VDEDVLVVGADRRGSGPNRQGRGDAPSAIQLVDDVLAIISAQRDRSRPLFLLGWCWGAALAVNVAHKLGPALDGIVLVTPGMFPSLEVQRAATAALENAEDRPPHEVCLPTPIRDTMFTEGPALVDFIRRDRERLLEIAPRLLTISQKLAAAAMARMRRLQAPLLVVLADNDEATDNAAALAAFARIAGPRRPRTVTIGGRHGLQFDAPDALGDQLVAFIRSNLRNTA
jgi:alpha-beta hydrolase superfamily lysophospholipase